MLPLILGAAAAGGLAGMLGDKSRQTYGMYLDPASENETYATSQILNRFKQLGSMVDAGPGQQDITAALGATRGYADMLGRYAQPGGAMPTQADIDSSNNTAGGLFNARRTMLNQNFDDARVQASRLAARMNRPTNDPILQAKLLQEQTRQSGMLDAEQMDMANGLAMQQPMQRLQFAGQQADTLNGLATQAMANRQAILAMGNNIQQNERNFRLATAQKYADTETGGGFKGFLTGALGGAASGMKLASAFGGGAAPTGGDVGGGSFGAVGSSGGGDMMGFGNNFGISAKPLSYFMGGQPAATPRTMVNRMTSQPAVFGPPTPPGYSSISYGPAPTTYNTNALQFMYGR